MNLLEQANKRVIQINKAMGEIEEFESVVNMAKSSQLSFYQNGVGTTHITVLNQDKMQQLKDVVLKAITDAQAEKTEELKQLLGIEKKKPAVINPEFEKAILDMEEQKIEKTLVVDSGSAKCVVVQKDKPEMTLDEVKRLYIDEGKTYQEMAEYFGVKKNAINNFIYRNNLTQLKQKHDCGYVAKKAKQPADKKEHP